jgi:hypothetical protein
LDLARIFVLVTKLHTGEDDRENGPHFLSDAELRAVKYDLRDELQGIDRYVQA